MRDDCHRIPAGKFRQERTEKPHSGGGQYNGPFRRGLETNDIGLIRIGFDQPGNAPTGFRSEC
jgi:hypothetical protein